jgi:DNA-binding NarL/FixJ family response regulator
MSTNLTEEKKPEVIALLLQGMTINEIHRQTGVSKSAIWRIKDNIIDGKYSGAILDLRDNLSEYIAVSLKKHLEALNAIAEVAVEKDYIRSNTARDIASLHERLECWTLSILQASNNINQKQLTSREETIDAEIIDDDEKPIS